jgi:hypothetical protein
MVGIVSHAEVKIKECGVAFIWLLYFTWDYAFRKTYEKGMEEGIEEGRKQTAIEE